MNRLAKKLSIFIFLSFIALATMFIIDCSRKKETSNKLTINFAVDKGAIVSALPIIADRNQFWEQTKINVKVSGFTSGRDAAQALLGGGADAATMADFPFMLSAHRDSTLRVIATIAESPYVIQIVANKSKGITKIQDLRNKRIGVTVGSAGQFYLDALLLENRIKPNEYERISLSPPEMVSAFVRGDLDAICTWQPHLFRAQESLGDNAILFSNQTVYTLTFNIVTRKDFIENHKTAVIEFLKGLSRASEFLRENQQKAISIISSETSTEMSLVQSIWKDYSFNLTISDNLKKALEKQEKWAYMQKILDKKEKKIDWDKIIDNTLLSQITKIEHYD